MESILFRRFMLFICLVCIIGLSSGQTQRDKEKQVKDQILGRAYDGTVLPRGDNGTGPVSVNVSLIINNLLALDESNKNLEVQLEMKLTWNDPRLSYTSFPPNSGPGSLTLSPSVIEKVWLPNIHIVNAVKIEVQKSNQYMQISLNNGDVKYSILLKITTMCPIDLRRYPHDTQNCEIKLSSYGLSSKDIKLVWSEENSVSFLSDVKLPRFTLEDYDADTCDSSTDTGLISCLILEMSLKRESNYFLLNVYMPCSMLVIISWLSYWLHPLKSATVRVIICVSALGLAVIGSNDFNKSLPIVSIIKSIDIWIGICLTILFLAVVEFIIVNYLNQYGGCCFHNFCSDKKIISDSSETAEQQTPLNPSGGEEKRQRKTLETTNNVNKWGSLLDVIFRIAIPILFLTFIIVYWVIFV